LCSIGAVAEEVMGGSYGYRKIFRNNETVGYEKEGKARRVRRAERLFERFHLLNRNYLDKEAFEKAQESIASMAEAIVNTVQYLDAEIVRLRSKRMKLPFENVTLSDMQKVKNKNEMLLREYLAGLQKE
jgi:hypothetical protein